MEQYSYEDYLSMPYDELSNLIDEEWLRQNPYFWYDRVMFDLKDNDYIALLEKYIVFGVVDQIRPLFHLAGRREGSEYVELLKDKATFWASYLFNKASTEKTDLILTELIMSGAILEKERESIVIRMLSHRGPLAEKALAKAITYLTIDTILAGKYKKRAKARMFNMRAIAAIASNLDLVEALYKDSSNLYDRLYRKLMDGDAFGLMNEALTRSEGFRKYVAEKSHNSSYLSPPMTSMLRSHGIPVSGLVYTRVKGKGSKLLPRKGSVALEQLKGKDRDDVIEALDTGVWPESHLRGKKIEVRITGPNGNRSFYIPYGTRLDNPLAHESKSNPTRLETTRSMAEYLRTFKPTPIETISVYQITKDPLRKTKTKK